MKLINDLRWRHNEALARREYRQRRDKLAARPRFLIIDPTSRCTARCVMCPQTFRNPADRGSDLPRAVFSAIAPVIPLAAHINLFSTGEPTLAADLAFFLKETSRRSNRQAKIWLSTNGKFIPPAVLELLQAPNLGLQFSVDGGTREVFEAIRPGVSFAELCHTLELASRRRGARPYPLLSFSCTMSKRNIHDLGNIFLLAKKYSIDQLIVYEEDPEVPAEQAFVLDASDRPVYEAQLPLISGTGLHAQIALTFGRHEDIPAVASPPGFDPGPIVCRAPWKVFHLQADGGVRTCCTLRTEMGNLNRQTFAAVWNGEPYRALRRAFVTQSGIPPACLTCTDPLRN